MSFQRDCNAVLYTYYEKAPDDDDELDEENLPGFSTGPPPMDKGKGCAHAHEQLAPPSNNAGMSSPILSGNIGGLTGGASLPTRLVSSSWNGQLLLCMVHE
jgi:hypothetical protein